MLCSEETLVNSDARQGVAVTLRCKRWSCEICRPFNKRAVVRKAVEGRPTLFITLTVNPRHGADQDERARQLVKAWRTIRRRATKKYRYKSIPFIAVFEKTKRGEPHLHILARCAWLDQRWLSAQASEEIDAPIVDVRKVTGEKQAACYCAKYVGKDPHVFRGTKRFWSSLDWLALAATDDLRPALFGDRWIRHRHDLNSVERQLIAQGYYTLRTPHKIVFSDEAPP